ncbi:hypothetical protein KIL84_017426 [Mauremys mutica]|uniref:Uncharacterized protein n=1 Tax=Mauremys mutica TaxID=74926 RepID=A0A9D3X4U3_9SAUR|nr:hypothetical protein KIL84_017426 [Mauremys mutica]
MKYIFFPLGSDVHKQVFKTLFEIRREVSLLHCDLRCRHLIFIGRFVTGISRAKLHKYRSLSVHYGPVLRALRSSGHQAPPSPSTHTQGSLHLQKGRFHLCYILTGNHFMGTLQCTRSAEVKGAGPSIVLLLQVPTCRGRGTYYKLIYPKTVFCAIKETYPRGVRSNHPIENPRKQNSCLEPAVAAGVKSRVDTKTIFSAQSNIFPLD